MTEEQIKQRAREKAKEIEENQTIGIYDDDESLAYDKGYNSGEVTGYEEGYIAGATEATKELLKENAELKGLKDVATLIRANNDTVTTLMQLNNKLVYANQLINKLKKCDNCKENTTMNPYCIDCENHSKWVLAD